MPRSQLDETFDGDDLDADVWCASYLPHWSSMAASRATYRVADNELTLSIPAEQGLWCADLHETPLRVSCIQSANLSGPVGSTNGPQRFRDELVVAEEQRAFLGYTPRYGRIEITMRGNVTERSMFALWLSGIEDEPDRCGEICVAEIFGNAIRDGSAEVGMGIKAFRDPKLRDDFEAVRLPIDIAQLHTYAVDWTPQGLVFEVDGDVVRRCDQAPDYPVQLMLGVFDFPADGGPGPVPTPSLVATRIVGTPIS